MRHRVEAGELPNPLHAVWNGEVYPAQRSSTDGTVLLIATGGTTPDGFDDEWNGAPAKVIADGQAATFSVQAHCVFDDEVFRVDRTDGDDLVLRWTGHDETVAAELGLTDFTTTAPNSAVTALWQQRHDFPGEVSARPAPATGDQTTLLHTIGRMLAGLRADETFTVGAQFRQLGDYGELEVRAVTDDLVVAIAPPPSLGQVFSELRSAMYVAGAGTWLQGTFTLNPGTSFDFDFDADNEPQWRLPPHEGGQPMSRTYSAELTHFERRRAAVPPWLAAKAGLPLDIGFRTAAAVDGKDGERPVVNRAPVPSEEIRPVLDYLYRSPVVLARGAQQPDLFAAGSPPDVPDAFHTDGTWIWPASVPHYLRKHGVPPEAALLEHIRANRHVPPFVPERVRATAEAEILGKPYPAQSEADLGAAGPVARVEREDELAPRLRASETLVVLRKRLAEHAVADTAYHIGEPPPETPNDTWCLRRGADGWEVSVVVDDAPFQPRLFDRVADAAQFLLGALLLYPARMHAGLSEPEPEEPSDRPPDWPILPLRGEPPLNLLRHKRMVLLPDGTVLRRFGNETGNLLHEHAATFGQTSLLPDRERERHTYVVRRPLWVLAGIAAPWQNMPGGALAYLLPRPIGHHVETGALARQ